MTDQFVGEIKMFSGEFVPMDWASANGTSVSVQDKATLFSVIGTTYGGDGKPNFLLPDMSGRAPVHFGNGKGLTPRSLGAKFGTEQVIVNVKGLPGHNHVFKATSAIATSPNPVGHVLAKVSTQDALYSSPRNLRSFATDAVAESGNAQPHNNMMPYSVVKFIICLSGYYPDLQ